MSRSDIHVLMAGPQLPELAEPVERDYVVHKLWLAHDRAAFLAERADLIRGIVTNAPVGASAALMAALPRLEIVSSSGVGLDAIDLDAARARGIVVCSTPGVLNECVADTGMALLLAVARRVCEADRFVRAGRWLQGKFPLGTSLGGKTVGILGMGNIGQAVARRAAAFGMRVAYFDPFPKPGLDHAQYADPVSLAQASDFLVLTLPGGPQTERIVGAEVLAALGPAGFVVNIARGSVLDHEALLQALRGRAIAGAALDVFDDEPQVPAALLDFDNVVLTPHIASGTNETRRAMSELAFANLQAHFEGRPVLTRVV